MRLPAPRGPVSEWLIDCLEQPVGPVGPPPPRLEEDPLSGEDLHLSLYVLYELNYRGFEGVDDEWEWEAPLLAVRRELERVFEAALDRAVPHSESQDPGATDRSLRAVLDADDGPALSRYLGREGTLDQYIEFLVHKSAYHLKEADPHAWAIPRMTGRPKAALLEIEFDEFGNADAARMHSTLFGDTLEGLGLDRGYGAYLDYLPGVTLATVNLMSLFGLHRRWAPAIAGHLAAFEMNSSEPSRRLANGLRRLGFDERVTEFYDEHVEADAVHENIAAVDLGRGLAEQQPASAATILFGARALLALEARFAHHLLDSWREGRTSLRRPLPSPVPS